MKFEHRRVFGESLRDLQSLRRLLRYRRATALFVLVPAAQGPIASAREEHGEGRAWPLPPHVTVLYPFLPGHRIRRSDVEDLRRIAASFKSFRFCLSHVARFPGVLYLAPRRSGPFVDLTLTFCRHWPSVRPYEGKFDEIVPHVTVLIGPEPPGIAASLERQLPIEATASSVVLALRGWRGRWRPLAVFPLAE